MATLFLPGNRQSFYFRAVVPRERVQLGRTLSTDIEDLIARTMDAELEKSEDYRALHRLNEVQREIMVDETIDRLEETEGTLFANRYDRVAGEVEAMLRASGMPALDPNSLPFKRACRAFLLAKQGILETEIERWQGKYHVKNCVPLLLLWSQAVLTAPQASQSRRVPCSPSSSRNTSQRIIVLAGLPIKYGWSLKSFRRLSVGTER